jgi:F0F1-type ATP synthase delta subunit
MSETVKVKIKSMSELFETHLDYFTEFYNVLDENQKAQIIQAMREKMKKHK